MLLLEVSTYQSHFIHSQPLKSVFLVIFSYFLSLFLAQLSSKFSKEAEIRYVHLAGVLNVPFGGLDFSTSFHPLTATKDWFFGRFFFFF